MKGIVLGGVLSALQGRNGREDVQIFWVLRIRVGALFIFGRVLKRLEVLDGKIELLANNTDVLVLAGAFDDAKLSKEILVNILQTVASTVLTACKIASVAVLIMNGRGGLAPPLEA